MDSFDKVVDPRRATMKIIIVLAESCTLQRNHVLSFPTTFHGVSPIGFHNRGPVIPVIRLPLSDEFICSVQCKNLIGCDGPGLKKNGVR